MASLPDIDVEQIARAAQAGDDAALGDLLARVRPRVFRWAVVKTRDADEAEDIVQEVALVLLRRLDGYRGGSFAAWLYRVTSNAVHDARRRRKRRGGVRWSDEIDMDRPVAQDALNALLPYRGYSLLDDASFSTTEWSTFSLEGGSPFAIQGEVQEVRMHANGSATIGITIVGRTEARLGDRLSSTVNAPFGETVVVAAHRSNDGGQALIVALRTDSEGADDAPPSPREPSSVPR